MKFIADFHIHSHYSRATSKDCRPEMLNLWALKKGIDIQGTGDFTHPGWRKELDEKLVLSDEGLYVLKDEFLEDSSPQQKKVKFIISGEISSIYKKNGKTRKVHNVILLPNILAAQRLSKRLEAIGNLHSDGRPILGLDSKTLLDITLSVCPEAIFIPAHIWTPHFSLFGSKSGFDAIEECFEDLTEHIYALETGLSSDPPMNWRVSNIDRFALVSNSDAHSPGNLAREANIFDTDTSYAAIYSALKNNDKKAFVGTIEFFPEEGKYHLDGHRACKIQWEPSRTIAASGICPVCGGNLTVGVLHRVEELADREEHFKPLDARLFERIVPLAQILSSCIGSPVSSGKVAIRHQTMLEELGSELSILREIPIGDIKTAAGDLIAEGIRRMRIGQLQISAGYDGEYGVVEIFNGQQRNAFIGQSDLFGEKVAANLKKHKELEKLKKTPKAQTGQIQTNVSEAAAPNPFGLNNDQWEAVASSNQAVMVIAGPGTGKTKTLISRIVYLVNEQKVAPSDILAITFTNKAAAEMRHRLHALFDSKMTSVPTIGTFHSVCLALLKNNDTQEISGVIDQAAAQAILADVIKAQAPELSVGEVGKTISLAKARGREALHALDEKTTIIYNIYQSLLDNLSVMDFDDILLCCLEKSENNSSPNQLGAKWKHILVDEFQDINEVQFSLIRHWGKSAHSVFVIGDPNQSIYGFRGASPEYFDQFAKEFPNLKRVTLLDNYRSPAQVALSAMSVISKGHDSGISAATVRCFSRNDRKIRIVETKDEFSEALFITKEINRMIGGIDMLDAHIYGSSGKKDQAGSKGFFDFAVLYRTHRQANIIEQCFIKEGIQYKIAGRSDFLDHKEVRRAISFFRLMINKNDICSLAQFLSLDKVDSIQEILDAYSAGNYELSAIGAIIENRNFSISTITTIKNLIDQEALFRSRIAVEKPSKLLRDWLKAQKIQDDDSAYLAVSMAEMHDTMTSLLYTLTMGQDADVLRKGAKTISPDAVTLSTLHAAKGLEFPVVFICGVNESLIPFKNSFEDENGIDEERRLFYVGLTRTKEDLICTYTRQRSLKGLREPTPLSRFIKDMGEKHLLREKFRPEPGARQMSFL